MAFFSYFLLMFDKLCPFFIFVPRKTEKVSQEFLTGVGNQLNKELIAEDGKNKHTSYISGNVLFCFSLICNFNA